MFSNFIIEFLSLILAMICEYYIVTLCLRNFFKDKIIFTDISEFERWEK